MIWVRVETPPNYQQSLKSIGSILCVKTQFRVGDMFEFGFIFYSCLLIFHGFWDELKRAQSITIH